MIVFDQLTLTMMVILRKSNVSRVPNDVDDLLIARVEGIVGSDDARPRHPFEMALGHDFWRRNQAINGAPVRVLIRIEQVCDQETSPRVACFRIGDEKDVARKDGKFVARAVQPKDPLRSSNNTPQPFPSFLPPPPLLPFPSLAHPPP